MQKTYKFKTQCKGDISHAFETAKITVFYPTVCKTPEVPLQNELDLEGLLLRKRKEGEGKEGEERGPPALPLHPHPLHSR